MERPEVAFRVASVTDVAADAVVVNLFEGVRSPGGATGAVDAALGGAIREAIACGELRGRLGETLVIHTLGRLPARRVIVAGLGPREEFGRRAAREASAAALRAARRHGCRTVATIAHGAGIGGLDPRVAALATVEGGLLGLYRYRPRPASGGRAHSPDEDAGGRVEQLWLIDRTDQQRQALEAGLEEGRIIAEAVMTARELGNRPANDLTPPRLADAARELERLEGVRVEVLDEEALRSRGFGAILAVAAGSAQPPRLAVITYTGPGRGDAGPADVALVGKGVTFDSGGISLKSREGMEDMKFDMMGAAAVIGAISAIARLRLPLKVLGMVAAVENLPGGRAFKPGDVITTYAGKTVEINNTDAEGRLILADALAYARELGTRRLVDLATLTGAMVIALGDEVAGMMANDDHWAARVSRAAESAGEMLWRLPLVAAYRERLRSQYADIRNTGGRPAGSITAALFLQEFVGDTPWAHLDIAGVAWSDKVAGDHGKGATGYGVRTLVELARQLAAEATGER